MIDGVTEMMVYIVGYTVPYASSTIEHVVADREEAIRLRNALSTGNDRWIEVWEVGVGQVGEIDDERYNPIRTTC